MSIAGLDVPGAKKLTPVPSAELRKHLGFVDLVFACVLMVVIPYLLGMEFWGGWLFWAVLLFAFGLGHPVTADVDTPLDPMRRFAAWATIVLFIVTFMPVPVSLVPGSSPAQPAEKLYNVMETTPAPIVGGSGFGRHL